MPLGEHLEELRRRIVAALYGLVPIFLIALYFGKDILRLILLPVEKALRESGQGGRPVIIAPFEALNAYLKISFIAALLVGSPWVLYQVWLFIAPGLYNREKRFVYFLLPLSVFLTIGGVAFFYFATLPIILHFLIEFGADLGMAPAATTALAEGTVLPTAPALAADPTSPPIGSYWINTTIHELRFQVAADKIMGVALHATNGVVPEFRVSESVKLILNFSLAFAAAFQLPVIVLLLGWAGIVTVPFLSTYRRHALLVISIIAALLTPADPFSMLFMMAALYALYEVGIVLLRCFPASRVAGGPISSSRDLATAQPGTPREPADAGDP